MLFKLFYPTDLQLPLLLVLIFLPKDLAKMIPQLSNIQVQVLQNARCVRGIQMKVWLFSRRTKHGSSKYGKPIYTKSDKFNSSDM